MLTCWAKRSRKSRKSWASPLRSSPARRVVIVALAGLVVSVASIARTRQPATTSAPSDPNLADQWAICFAPAGRKIKTFSGEGVVVWTDAPVKGKELLRDLQAVGKYLQQIAPRPSSSTAPSARPPRPVAIAIYNKPADYHKLWQRVGAHYNGRFGKVVTEGYSYRVFCATSYGSAEAFARRRGVVAHEFAHVWLYQNRRLANDGNWLTEGIANAVQLRIAPDSGNRADFARWMERGRMLPLKRLMDQPRIAPKDYWQAATLIETLLDRPASAPNPLPAVIAAYNRGDSAYAIVTKTLGTDFAALQSRWTDHVRRRGKVPSSRPARGK